MDSREKYVITDGRITVTVNKKGAEIASVIKDGKEYMWSADSAYWARTAPVLFPVVGSLRDKKYRYNGTEYSMGQHGFARDTEFEAVDAERSRLTMAMTDSEKTFGVYPFHFRLEISYELEDGRLKVGWKVVNTGESTMYFSIGGHPAFMCPIDGESGYDGYALHLYRNGAPVEGFDCTPLTADGTAANRTEHYDTPDGVLAVSRELFLGDALILENGQADRVALAKPDKSEYVSLEFDAPLLGLWSPAGKDAPFVCIEPWYGRCDGEDFDGEIKDRKWGNSLNPGEEFRKSYTITYGDV